jgi:hypothetical protein
MTLRYIYILVLICSSCSLFKQKNSDRVVPPFLKTIDDSIVFRNQLYVHRIYHFGAATLIDGYWNFSNDTLKLIPAHRKQNCISNPVTFMVINESYGINHDPCQYSYLIDTWQYPTVCDSALDTIKGLYIAEHSLYEDGCYEVPDRKILKRKKLPMLKTNTFWINQDGVIVGYRVQTNRKGYLFSYESEL